MITDRETNFLYLADCLPEKYPALFDKFQRVLNEVGIPFDFLPNTKDIWTVDYMPIQVSKDRFVQFRYEPDYLMGTPEDKATISNVDTICQAIGIKPIKSNINLDGGNITKWKDKVILCDKVFHENPQLTEDELFEELMEYLNIKEENLKFVPEDELDFTGHSDGMLRFINANTVLINDYSKEDSEFKVLFQEAIDSTGLEVIVLPYEPENDPYLISAVGLYLNYLEMEQAVIIPVFNKPSDDKAVRILEDVFQGKTIRTVESADLARKGGGILNCFSWNILT